MFEIGDIPITPEVLTLIAEIDEFKGVWRALGVCPSIQNLSV
jgi:hypothetical protein